MHLNLFHAASYSTAHEIERNQRIDPGQRGFAGSAVYLSGSEYDACQQCFNGRSTVDVVILCIVDLGRCLETDEYYLDPLDQEQCATTEYDSIRKVCSDTYAVFDPSRIRILKFKSLRTAIGWCNSLQELQRHVAAKLRMGKLREQKKARKQRQLQLRKQLELQAEEHLQWEEEEEEDETRTDVLAVQPMQEALYWWRPLLVPALGIAAYCWMRTATAPKLRSLSL